MKLTKKKIKRIIRDPGSVQIYLENRMKKAFERKPRTRHYKTPITVTLKPPKIAKNAITFTWESSSKIPHVRKNTWPLVYPGYVDLSTVPRELLWMMYSLQTSEIFASTSNLTVVLPERVDSSFLKWWEGILRINHAANPYHENVSAQADFNLVNGEKEVRVNNPERADHFEYACMNGMGKDALVQMAVLRECNSQPILGVTVDNSWLFRKKSMFKKLTKLSEQLESYEIHNRLVATQIKESFDFRIVPWHIFSLPLLYLHDVKTCYWALEINFNKCCNGIPVKPNATTMVLESLNNLLRDLRYTFEFKSGVLPLTTFGTMKLLIERYPQMQKLQYSCMVRYPPCNSCQKCQSQMAYIQLCGRDYRDFGYREREIMDVSTLSPASILDIEREPIEHALNKVRGITDDLGWVEKYYKDAVPYAVPGMEHIVKEHFDGFEGPFTSYGIYTYDTREWDKIARTIYSSHKDRSS